MITPEKLSILIVDDQPLVLRSIHALCHLAGYEPTSTSSPSEAIDLITGGFQVGVLLTDIDMPEMTGFELAERVSRQWMLPIILMSGSLREGLEWPFLHKPFSFSQLQGTVSASLGR